MYRILKVAIVISVSLSPSQKHPMAQLNSLFAVWEGKTLQQPVLPHYSLSAQGQTVAHSLR